MRRIPHIYGNIRHFAKPSIFGVALTCLRGYIYMELYILDWQLCPDSGARIRVLSHHPRCLLLGTMMSKVFIQGTPYPCLILKEKSRTDRGWFTNLVRCGMALFPIYYLDPKSCNTLREVGHETYPALEIRWSWRDCVQYYHTMGGSAVRESMGRSSVSQNPDPRRISRSNKASPILCSPALPSPRTSQAWPVGKRSRSSW